VIGSRGDPKSSVPDDSQQTRAAFSNHELTAT
jgi:hypothetical protein